MKRRTAALTRMRSRRYRSLQECVLWMGITCSLTAVLSKAPDDSAPLRMLWLEPRSNGGTSFLYGKEFVAATILKHQILWDKS